MKQRLINCAAALMIVAGLTAPLAAWHFAGRSAKENQAALQRRQLELDRLAAQNVELSNKVSQIGKRIPDEQLKDLLGLRAEVARLRRQTNETERLAEENRRLQIEATFRRNPTADAQAEFIRELSVELKEAGRNIIAELPGARQRFLDTHEGKAPEDFADLIDYFPKIEGQEMRGLYFFDYVRYPEPQPGDSLILREMGPHRTADGQRARLYVFSDGQVTEVTAPDDGAEQEFYKNWEAQHMNSKPSQGK